MKIAIHGPHWYFKFTRWVWYHKRDISWAIQRWKHRRDKCDGFPHCPACSAEERELEARQDYQRYG